MMKLYLIIGIIGIVMVSGCTNISGPSYSIPDTCGNGVCDMVADDLIPINSWNLTENPSNCPEDCGVSNWSTSTYQNVAYNWRGPFVTGQYLEACTSGYIIEHWGKAYIITAAHCALNVPNNQYQLCNEVTIEDPDRCIGYTKKKISIYNNAIDLALIEIEPGIEYAKRTIYGHEYDGFAEPYVGMDVMKIGLASGITYGKVERILNYPNIAGTCYYLDVFRPCYNVSFVDISGLGITPGDSGSAILTAEEPHRLVSVTGAWKIPASQIRIILGV